MFNLSLFANPARLKREFLAVTEVTHQARPRELQQEFEQLKSEQPDAVMTGNFWRDFLRSYPRQLLTVMTGRVTNTLLILVAVLISQQLLDDSASFTAAIWMLVCYALVQLVMKIINAWVSMCSSQLMVCARTFVTLRMNMKLLRMGQITSDEFSTGNLKTLISSDIYRIGDILHSMSLNGIPCLLGLIFLGPVIVWNMGLPGLLAMAVGFGAMPLAFALGGYVHRKETAIKQEEDQLATIVGEWVTNVRLLRFLSWEPLMQRRVASHVRRLVIESTRQHSANLVNFGVSVTWWLLPIIVLLQTGDTSDMPTLFGSIWMLNHITLYIRWLPDIFINYAAASACVNRLESLFSQRDIADNLMDDWPTSVASAKPVRMHLNNVSFSYGEEPASSGQASPSGTAFEGADASTGPDSAEQTGEGSRDHADASVGHDSAGMADDSSPAQADAVTENDSAEQAGEGSRAQAVIKDLYLTLNLDETVSVIGKVGSGKSTLLKLICAELKPSSGTIQVEFDNGVLANLWHGNIYRRLRECIGYMPQEAYLSNTSLAINVALDSNCDEASVMQAIRLAELEADIQHWQGGLTEEVGETGVNLSGGQKQRVNLARALYSGRDFLVLDDPLSAVDTDTEALLMQSLVGQTQGFLLSSHRLSELEMTSRLLVMEDGAIVEDGNPSELMQDFTSHFSRYLWAGEVEVEV